MNGADQRGNLVAPALEVCIVAALDEAHFAKAPVEPGHGVRPTAASDPADSLSKFISLEGISPSLQQAASSQDHYSILLWQDR
jgi:hypothetical protein